MVTGYAHADYAASLADVGRPLLLPRSRGWLLERPIFDTGLTDAMGPYPLFACEDWACLSADLDDIAGSLLSVVLVADPFGRHDPALLARTFNRGAVPFKEHHVVELGEPLEKTVSSHHRRNVKKALREVTVERLTDPIASLDDWVKLYETLIARHAITGVQAFSRASFDRQLRTPGIIAYRAVRGGATVGMVLFYAESDIAYYHLGAYSPEGYDTGAAFAIFWTALRDLRGSVRLVSLGGDAGIGGETGGLGRFKRGWATTTRMAYLCRHVGDVVRYDELSRGREEQRYFPAYRAVET